MTRLGIAIFGALISSTVIAQGFNLDGLIQRGLNEAVRAITAPPPPFYSPPPVYSPPVQVPAKPQKKTRPSQPKIVKKPSANVIDDSGTAVTSATQGSSKENEKAAGTLVAVDDVVVTDSPMLDPIVLPMYKGSPIAYYAGISPLSKTRGYRRNHNMERWFTLAALATKPDSIEHPAPALGLANNYVAAQYWEKYFVCSRRPCKTDADARMDINYNIQNWKGDNEFERARAHQAFVKDYKDILLGQIPALPLEMYITTQAYLGTYSLQTKGMPLTWTTSITPDIGPERRINKDGLPVLFHRAIRLQGDHIARIQLALPQLLPCDPDDCERLLSGLDQHRSVHAVFKLRILAFGPFTDLRTRRKSTLFAEQVGPIVLHQDANLNTPLHTYSGPPTLPEPALLAKGSPNFKNAALPLNGETLQLLILKHHPEGQSKINFQETAQLRRAIDAVMYDRAALEGKWPETEPWGPFFHAVNTPEGALSDDVVQKYAAWTSARAQQPLDSLLLQFIQDKGSSHAYPPVIGKEHLLSRGFFDALADEERSFLRPVDQRHSSKDSPDMVIRRDLDNRGIVAADNLLLVQTGNEGSFQYVALALNAKLTDYLYPTSSLPANTADKVHRTSIEASIKSVTFESTSRGFVMVIQLLPKTARLYTPAGLLTEVAVASIVTPTAPMTAAQTLPVSPPTPTEAAVPDYDILGIKLGMPFEEGERIAREHLKPDLVYSIQRKSSMPDYGDGRLFVTLSRLEAITLIKRPDGTVGAITRSVSVPASTKTDTIREQVEEKYGRRATPADSVCVQSHGGSGRLQLLEGTEPSSLDIDVRPAATSVTHYRGHIAQIGIVRQQRDDEFIRDKCGPTMETRFQGLLPGNRQLREVQFQLFDHGAYLRAHEKISPSPKAEDVKLVM